MSGTMELLSIKTPNPSLMRRPSSSSYQVALSASSSLRFSHSSGPLVVSRRLVSTRGLGLGFPSLDRRISLSHSLVASAASHEDSKHSEIEVEKGNEDNDFGAENSQEAWKQALASFKEQALRMQALSQEAYKVNSKKALEILKDSSEQLQIRAEKTINDLGLIAKEFSEEGKEYISTAAVNSPEPVKEIVETFSSSTDDLTHISKVRDFHVGIPYGLLLSVGGFLSFMVTGSISAIRFGIILGGALLALSVSSLKAQKRGELFPFALKGQAALSAILSLREIRLLTQRPTLLSFVTTVVSVAVVAFYLYRIIGDGKWKATGSSDVEPGTTN